MPSEEKTISTGYAACVADDGQVDEIGPDKLTVVALRGDIDLPTETGPLAWKCRGKEHALHPGERTARDGDGKFPEGRNLPAPFG
jgi:hypothetical protein